MRFFISADIEGITDVTNWSETEAGGFGYEEARVQMSKEVAAACRALMDKGHEVCVRDGHDSALNIIHGMLPRGTVLMRGWMRPLSMMAGIEEGFDGALYIGYHSPVHMNTNPLAHCFSARHITRFEINGRSASEFTLNSLMAAEYGAPSIFISGDEGICGLAKEEIPDIGTFAVKRCIGNSTVNMHPEDAVEGIYNAVSEALEAPHDLIDVPEKLEVIVGVDSHSNVTNASYLKNAEIIDIHTIKFIIDKPHEVNLYRAVVQG